MKAYVETERKYYKYQYQDFVQPVLTSNGTLGGDSFAVAGNTNTFNAFNGATSGAYASGATNNTVIVYNPNPICLTNVYLNAYSYLHNVYGLQEVLCADTLDGEREVVFSQSIGDYTAERNYSFPNNTRYAKYWFITYASVGGGGYAIYEYQLTGTVQTFVESTESDYDFYKDIDTYKLPKGVVRKYYKYQYSDWTQPVLTSDTSSSLMTVSATTVYDGSNAAWKAFDNIDSTAWVTNIITNTGSLRVQFDRVLSIKSITVTGFRNASSYCKTVEIYKDINNTQLVGEQKQFYTSTGSSLDGVQTWTFDTPVETDFLSFYSTSPVVNGWTGISNIIINAVEVIVGEGTESDHDFYEDKEVYYAIGD